MGYQLKIYLVVFIKIIKALCLIFLLTNIISMLSKGMYYQYHFTIVWFVYVPVFIIFSFFEYKILQLKKSKRNFVKYIPFISVLITLFPFVVIDFDYISILSMILCLFIALILVIIELL